MSTVIQRNLAGGEIGPSVYSRTDTSKYQSAVRTMRNFLIMRHGGATSRPGSTYVGEVFDSDKLARLIPFIFNIDQTYALEFGDQTMRVIRNGAYLINERVITNITKAASAVVTVGNDHSFHIGDSVTFSGVVGMTQINGLTGTISATAATTITVGIDSTGFSNYASGGLATGEIYYIVTPYIDDDLVDLQFSQSADVVTLVHPSYAPRELSRTGHIDWEISLLTIAPSTPRPLAGSATPGGTGGGLNFRYRVTAVSSSFEESYTGYETQKTVTSATAAAPIVVTITAHGYDTGDDIHASLIFASGTVDESYTITKLSADTFSLLGSDALTFGAFTSGTVWRTFIKLVNVNEPTPSAPHVLTGFGNGVDNEYNIYRDLNGTFGFIGVASVTDIANIQPVFKDIGYTPDTTDTPPIESTPFEGTDNFPSTTSYVQQRRAFANTNNNPESVYLSRISKFTNFTSSAPIQDDDAVTFSMVSRQVNEVRHLVELAKLVVFTTAGEWVIEGGSDGVVTPTQINMKQHSYNGSAGLAPIVIDNTALYLQARGSIVRDLGFDIQSDGYRGNDLTIYAAHLFDGFEIVDWAYQKIPHSVVWAVRNDGKLVALTYVREQQIFGWHHHDTDGTYENVCVIPEGDEDAVYVVVKREINGSEVRYVERFASRRIDDIVDFVALDSALTFDGRNTTATNMTISGGTTWEYDETLTLTASASFFTMADEGNEIHLIGSDGTLIQFRIITYSSATVVTGHPQKTVPVAMRSVAINEWTRAVDTVTGLDHLEGKDVAVFADGYVAANPNNESYTIVTVTSGSITLDRPYGVIHVGLPYLCDLETLDVDTNQGESIVDKKMSVSQVTMHLEATRGVFVGPKSPEQNDRNLTGDLIYDLYEQKINETGDYEAPAELVTDHIKINIASEWNSNGRVFIRQIDPVPITVLSVAPSGLFPFR